MKKKNGRRFLEACVFVALMGCMLLGLGRLMERKASSNQFGPFLEDPQDYDVLFFGDSSFVNSLFPMELWNDYGIAGYNLSCYGNTMPVTYWAIMNALDYADPQLVVIAVNDVKKDLKVTGSSSDVHTAFDFYPLSRTKIAAIEDLMDDPLAVDDDGNRYQEMKWEYYFTLGKYHSRWSELTYADLTGSPSSLKGAEMKIGVAEAEEYDLIDPDRYDDETGVGYGYLRRTLEELADRGIEVLLVHLPYPASENAQMSANTVGSMAEEYGVSYIDFVSMDSVADYAVDCFDSHAHLNPSGALKVTDYLGRYMTEHYGLPDRRGAADYEEWPAQHEAYLAHKRDQIRVQSSLENLLMLLHDDSFSVSIAIREHAQLYWDDKLLTLLHNIAREHVFEEDAYAKWSNAMYPLDGLEDALWDDTAYFLTMDRKNAVIGEYTAEEAHAQRLSVFGADSWEEGKEIEILVTDAVTGEEIVRRQF